MAKNLKDALVGKTITDVSVHGVGADQEIKIEFSGRSELYIGFDDLLVKDNTPEEFQEEEDSVVVRLRSAIRVKFFEPE